MNQTAFKNSTALRQRTIEIKEIEKMKHKKQHTETIKSRKFHQQHFLLYVILSKKKLKLIKTNKELNEVLFPQCTLNVFIYERKP